MKKLVVLVMCGLAFEALAAELDRGAMRSAPIALNATSLVGVSLTTNAIAQLPSRDATSPDTVFLGVVRALRTGNLRDIYYHFETNYLFTIAGCYNVEDIPDESVSSFQTVMTDSNFSNIVIIAYSTTVSNRITRISATLKENYSCRTLIEPLVLSVQRNEGSTNWKIVSYDDDKWDD